MYDANNNANNDAKNALSHMLNGIGGLHNEVHATLSCTCNTAEVCNKAEVKTCKNTFFGKKRQMLV